MTSPADSHPLANDAALRRRLLAWAGHWLRHGAQAEDLVQETWLRTAHGGMPAEAGPREAWLVTVLRHLCIDAWRRQRRYGDILVQLGEEGATSESAVPERMLEQAQRVAQALLHLVQCLPAGDVATVLLYEVFDFSHAELGALTGRSEAASRQQLRRLLERLRREPQRTQAADDDIGCLLTLCQRALAQRDPAGLVAVLRASRPQAMALSAQALLQGGSGQGGDAGEKPPMTRLIRIGNLLALQVQTPGGLLACLPLGEAIAELA